MLESTLISTTPNSDVGLLTLRIINSQLYCEPLFIYALGSIPKIQCVRFLALQEKYDLVHNLMSFFDYHV